MPSDHHHDAGPSRTSGPEGRRGRRDCQACPVNPDLPDRRGFRGRRVSLDHRASLAARGRRAHPVNRDHRALPAPPVCQARSALPVRRVKACSQADGDGDAGRAGAGRLHLRRDRRAPARQRPGTGARRSLSPQLTPRSGAGRAPALECSRRTDVGVVCRRWRVARAPPQFGNGGTPMPPLWRGWPTIARCGSDCATCSLSVRARRRAGVHRAAQGGSIHGPTSPSRPTASWPAASATFARPTSSGSAPKSATGSAARSGAAASPPRRSAPHRACLRRGSGAAPAVGGPVRAQRRVGARAREVRLPARRHAPAERDQGRRRARPVDVPITRDDLDSTLRHAANPSRLVQLRRWAVLLDSAFKAPGCRSGSASTQSWGSSRASAS